MSSHFVLVGIACYISNTEEEEEEKEGKVQLIFWANFDDPLSPPPHH